MNKEFFEEIKENNTRITTSSKLSIELSDEDTPVDKQIMDAIDKWIKDYNRGKDYIEIYADYNDEFPRKDIQKVLNAKVPFDTFSDIISDAYLDYDTSYDEDEIVKDLDLDEDFKEENDDRIREFIRDRIYWEPPYDHFKEDVPVDVFVNEGEETAEELITFDDDGKAISLARPVIWLLERQGYSVGEFLEYYNSLEDFDRGTGKTKYDTNNFLGSLVQEIDNFTGTYAELVFLGEINLGDFIEKWEYIHIPEKTICGIVDTYNGAGSVLEIKLEKAINLPRNEVTINYKDGYKYNVDDIYGLVGSAWNTQFKLEEASKAI